MKNNIKILAVLLILCMCTACSKDMSVNSKSTTKEATSSATKETTEKTSKEEKTTSSKTEKATEKATVKQNKNTVTSKYYDIELVKCDFVKDEGHDLIVFDLKLTNKAKDEITFGYDLSVIAFQNGASANEAILYEGYDWAAEFEKSCVPLKGGESATVKYAYYLDDESTVKIVVMDYSYLIHFEQDVDFKKESTKADKKAKTSIEYTGYRLFTDVFDNKCIAIQYKYTNGSDHIEAINNKYRLLAFQNGISIGDAFIEPANDNATGEYTYILPGYSVDVEFKRQLNDNTDVTINLVEYENFDEKIISSEVIKMDGGEGLKPDVGHETSVNIVNHETIEEDGNKCILLSIDCYNGNSDEYLCPFDLSMDVTQDGNKLYESFILNGPDYYKNDEQYKYIMPGYKNTIYVVYKLENTSDIHIEIKDELNNKQLLSENITP